MGENTVTNFTAAFGPEVVSERLAALATGTAVLATKVIGRRASAPEIAS